MTNEERRAALNFAREKALENAQAAEVHHSDLALRKANMWALVANAMKDGDPVHDAPDGRPANAFARPSVLDTEYGTITR